MIGDRETPGLECSKTSSSIFSTAIAAKSTARTRYRGKNIFLFDRGYYRRSVPLQGLLHPPSWFLAECSLCREALIGRRSDYLHERLVRLSMKEYSLDDFLDKKEREYEPFREKYRGTF